MRLLVVGGTGFLGGAVARAAVLAGHMVTVMTRGGKAVAKGAVPLLADRLGPLPDLHGQFDGVIDTCAYVPDMVTGLARAVGPVQSYVLVSSISAYEALPEPDLDETASVRPASPAELAAAASVTPSDNASAYGSAYGPLKVSCERAATRWAGPNAALIRLGLIVGPGDYTDRFTWWVRRADQGGELALPAPADRAVQFIDVRDAARFLLHLAETGQGGPFNVTGQPMGLADLIGQMVAVAGSGTQACTRPLSAFLDAGITPWTGLPLVLPDDPAIAGMLQVDTARARTAGLTTRPLQETISAVLDWDRTRRDVALVCGFDPVAAAKVLAANP